VARYKQFLHLHAICHGQFLVPPYDVDLVWHTHMVRALPAHRIRGWTRRTRD
jgi:hypothetical protein